MRGLQHSPIRRASELGLLCCGVQYWTFFISWVTFKSKMKRGLNITELNHGWRIVPALLLDTARDPSLSCLMASDAEAGIPSDAWSQWPGLPPVARAWGKLACFTWRRLWAPGSCWPHHLPCRMKCHFRLFSLPSLPFHTCRSTSGMGRDGLLNWST